MWQNPSEINLELTQFIPVQGLATLLKVSNALASTLELSDVLQIAITSITNLLDIETGAIYILDDDGLYLGATTPPLPPLFSDLHRLADLRDHPRIQETMLTKAPVFLPDARTATLTPAEKSVVDSRHLVSILYFPLLLKEKAMGAFIVGTTEDIRQFSDNEMDMCKILSSQSSLAIANARLYQESQQTMAELTRAYDATLEGWSRVLDMRDRITDQHTHRVVELTDALARRMGFPESELEHIRRGALLHDIGKMGIPDAILQKPETLTAAETVIMETHPVLARQLLSQIDYLVPALDIPYCHHEKWDGTGYPRGLKGKEIPLAARIFVIVDVYDALISDRPYRKAWEQKKVLDYIREESGKHFSPEVVDAFFDLLGASEEDGHLPASSGSAGLSTGNPSIP